MLRQSLRRSLRLGAEASPLARAPQWRNSGTSAPPGQQPAGAAAKPPADAAAEAAAAQQARALTEAKLENHLASAMLFPWERAAFGDRTQKLAWWQKAYWVGFACVFTYWAAEKSYNKVTTGKWHGDAPLPPAAAKARLKPTLFKSKVNEALGGNSFIGEEDDDDPFEGMTPEEIQALVAKEAPRGDAFEGMSPEEINTYLQREAAERDGAPLDMQAAKA